MNFKKWIEERDKDLMLIIRPPVLTEGATASRYSVEVNFRTRPNEMLKEFSKILLGYVSAALKQNNYHIKHVFDEDPVRILVSSRNWDDGEWCGVVNFNPDQNTFVISKGFYNKDRRTVAIQNSQKCKGDNAAEIVKELRNLMHSVKGQPDKHMEKLKGIKMKRGPKR